MFFCLLWVGIAAVGCKSKPLTLTSKDKKVQLTVFKGMVKSDSLHKHAELQASNIFAELYVVVFNEKKTSFPANIDLKRYDALVRNNMKKKLGSTGRKEKPNDVKINGHSAVQGALFGNIGKVKVGYLLTSIETQDSYHQVLAWTLRSHFNKQLPTFVKMTNTFKRIDGPKPTPGSKPQPSRKAPAARRPKAPAARK